MVAGRCEFLGFRSDVVEVFVLVAYDIASVGHWVITVSNVQRKIIIELNSVEEETSTLSRNVGHQSPSDAAPHPRRTETSSNNA
jgi:hypothetical protein